MRQKSGPEKQPAEEAIKDIRRATRRHFSAEEKIRVVLEGLRGETLRQQPMQFPQPSTRWWICHDLHYQRLSRAATDPAVVSRRVGGGIAIDACLPENGQGPLRADREDEIHERNSRPDLRYIRHARRLARRHDRASVVVGRRQRHSGRLADACRCVADGLSALP